MSYPFDIQRSVFERGEKVRHLTIVNNDTGSFKGALVKRYSVGTSWGNLEVETYSTREDLSAAVTAFSNNCRGFTKKTIAEPLLSATDATELKRIFGSMWYKMGKENIQFLDPEADVTGVREPIRYERQGSRYVPITPPPRLVEEPPPAPITLRDRLAANPNWGSF